MSVLHGVAGSLAVLAGFTRRAPGWWQDHGRGRTGGTPQEIVRPGRTPLGTNLTFASLVAREWLRRRLPELAAQPGVQARAVAAPRPGPVLGGPLRPGPVLGGPLRRAGQAGWAGAAEHAAESEDAGEPGWATDPEWAAEAAEQADRKQPAAQGKRS